MPGKPEEQLLYEVNLAPFINKGLDCEQITTELFQLHKEYINAKVIARNQVNRLVDRILQRLSPSHPSAQANKENSPGLSNSQRSGLHMDVKGKGDSKNKM